MHLSNDSGVRQLDSAAKGLSQTHHIGWIGCKIGGEDRVNDHVGEIPCRIELRGPEQEFIKAPSERVSERSGHASADEGAYNLVGADDETQTTVTGQRGESEKSGEQSHHPGVQMAGSTSDLQHRQRGIVTKDGTH